MSGSRPRFAKKPRWPPQGAMTTCVVGEYVACSNEVIGTIGSFAAVRISVGTAILASRLQLLARA